MHPIILLVAAIGALMGAVMASWLSAVFHRIPRRMDIIADRSRCPGCDTQISSRDNIPVVGWLALRGRCRACDARISVRYLMMEVIGAVTGAVIGITLGPLALIAAVALIIGIPVIVHYLRGSAPAGHE